MIAAVSALFIKTIIGLQQQPVLSARWFHILSSCLVIHTVLAVMEWNFKKSEINTGLGSMSLKTIMVIWTGHTITAISFYSWKLTRLHFQAITTPLKCGIGTFASLINVLDQKPGLAVR